MEFHPILPTVLSRFTIPIADEDRINTRLASARQNIEHIFALHCNIFDLFHNPRHFQLLHYGKEVHLIFNSFLLLNCYNCFNGSAYSFGMTPPSLAYYLPLNQNLTVAPEITDEMLGDLYRYNV